MRLILKIIGIIVLVLILIVAIMAIFKICPPAGPWPMPPWCESGKTKVAAGEPATVSLAVTIPYSLSSSENLQLAIENNTEQSMTKNGLLSWNTEIQSKTGDTIKYRFQQGNNVSTWRELKVAAVETVKYDYITGWTTSFFHPNFPSDFSLGINMADTWGRNYNFSMFEDTRDNIESSLERVALTGAQEVYVHDFLWAVYDNDQSFSVDNTAYKIEGDVFTNDMRDQEITQAEMTKLAKAAHSKDLKIAWRTNFTFINTGKYMTSGNITEALAKDWKEFDKPKTEEWVNDYFNKWEAALMTRAKMLDKAGFDIMIITPHFMNPEFSPYEELANKRLKQMIKNIKTVYHGQVGVIVHQAGFIGENWNDDWSKYNFYKEADLVYYQMLGAMPEKYKLSPEPSLTEIKQKLNQYLDDLEARAAAEDITLSLIFGFASSENFMVKGSMEIYDLLNPDIDSYISDWQYQADLYETFLQSAENRSQINKIIFFSYWWDDAMDPDDTKVKISISHSFRNKPAEAVFQKWAFALK